MCSHTFHSAWRGFQKPKDAGNDAGKSLWGVNGLAIEVQTSRSIPSEHEKMIHINTLEISEAVSKKNACIFLKNRFSVPEPSADTGSDMVGNKTASTKNIRTIW